MAKKWNPDANGLWSWTRHPDGMQSFVDNPPRSVDEAIERKTNMYVRKDGSIRTLRAKSRATVYKGLKFEDEDYERRKSNRGNPSKRGEAEKLVTPDRATRQAADRQMARTAAKGMVEHHGLPVSYLAAGEREKPGTVAKYEKVHGKGKVGHAPGALTEMSIPEHKYLHNVLEPAYERSIKGAKGSLDPIDLIRQQVRFLESNPMARRSLAVVLPVATPMLAAMDVQAREEAVQQDPSILNKLQAGLSKVELAGETGSLAGMATAATGVGAVPGAALMAGSEVVSSAAGLANLTIDGVRSAVMFGTHNRIRGRSGAMRATSP